MCIFYKEVKEIFEAYYLCQGFKKSKKYSKICPLNEKGYTKIIMQNKIQRIIRLVSMILLSITFSVQSNAASYGAALCHSPGFTCYLVKRGDTWEKIAPDLQQRDLLQRLNRMNINPIPGTYIAMPVDLKDMTIYDVSPFPRYITPPGVRTIYVSQKDLAWGAYDPQGNLVWWGPISPGKSYCPDVHKSCSTPNGSYYVQRKGNINCVSSQFPLKNKDGTKGGAPMPYCMHFWGGYALHGSTDVPGYAASHGCIRMFTQDAKWLNQYFVTLPQPGGQLGTHVIISENIV